MDIITCRNEIVVANSFQILTWNCQGAFRKKYPLIAEIAPDLAVIQECEQLERIPWKQGKPPTAMLWFGDKPTKGLGVFSWTGVDLTQADVYDASIRHCAPVQVQSPFAFHVVGVWAMDHKDAKLSYSAQAYQAIAHYRDYILASDTVFLGDFNSNQRSTPRSRIGNHITLTNALSGLGMMSAYHFAYGERQGQERRATYYQARKIDRPSHIDYVYFPTRWLRRLRKVEVGEAATWLTHSDHCPLVVEFSPKEKESMV